MNPTGSGREEYLTILAPTATEIMAQFNQRALGAEGYAIAGKMGRHQFSLVRPDGSIELQSGDGLIAATFSRRVTE
jgi:hypothetical protein